MRRSLRLLGLVLFIAMIAQPAMAEKFFIYVYDVDKNTVEDALVKVWQGDSLIDSGYTDSDGIFPTYLNLGTEYTIKATSYNREGVDTSTAESSRGHRIEITIKNK